MIRCGECEALITAEEKVQVRCSVCRHKFSTRNKDACPKCNTSIDEMSGPVHRHYIYYHCTKTKSPSCTQKGIESKELEKQIDEYLSRIEISKRAMDWTIKFLHNSREKEIGWIKSTVQTQQRAYQDCIRQLDNLVRLRTSPVNADGSLLSNEEYLRQRAELLKEKGRIEELLGDAGHNIDTWLENCENIFKFAYNVRKWFKNGDKQRKREILLALSSNQTLKDKKLSIQAKKPFLFLEKSRTGIAAQNFTFEPGTYGLNKRKTEANASVCPGGLGDVDDIRTYKEILPSQRTKIQRLVDEVLNFFKTSKEYIHIPLYDMNDDTQAGENNITA